MPPKTPPVRLPSPQERALERWRRRAKEGGYDPSEIDQDENHYDKMSDEEWAGVWRHVVAAVGNKPMPEEGGIRELVDDAAYSSGWFVNYQYYDPKPSDLRRYAEEKRAFLKKVALFRAAATEFFGDDVDETERYQPWEREKKILPVLMDLEYILVKQILQDEERADRLGPEPPNTLKPERDLWMARLLVAWRDGCGLPVTNSKYLRGFLSDAVRPYRNDSDDRAAKYFIKRWVDGAIDEPSPSLSMRLKKGPFPKDK